MHMRRTVYIMVGLPGSGKTTLAKRMFPGAESISSDYFIEQFAKRVGMTYKEVFPQNWQHAESVFNSRIAACARAYSMDLVVDRTHLTEASRQRIRNVIKINLPKFSIAPGADFNYVAVVVQTDIENIYARNDERLFYGRDIPLDVLKDMISRFDISNIENEGFDKVLYINT